MRRTLHQKCVSLLFKNTEYALLTCVLNCLNPCPHDLKGFALQLCFSLRKRNGESFVRKRDFGAFESFEGPKRSLCVCVCVFSFFLRGNNSEHLALPNVESKKQRSISLPLKGRNSPVHLSELSYFDLGSCMAFCTCFEPMQGKETIQRFQVPNSARQFSHPLPPA